MKTFTFICLLEIAIIIVLAILYRYIIENDFFEPSHETFSLFNAVFRLEYGLRNIIIKYNIRNKISK